MQGWWLVLSLAACGWFGGSATSSSPPPEEAPAGVGRLEADGGMPLAFTKAWGGYPVAVRLGLSYEAFSDLHGVSATKGVFQLPKIDGGLTQLMAHAGPCIAEPDGCADTTVRTVIALVPGEEACASTMHDLTERYGPPTSTATLEGLGSAPAEVARWEARDVVVKHQHGVMGKLVLCSVAYETPGLTP